MLACTKDSKETVELLVRSHASLSLRNKDGWTPFHIACREGHRAIVSFLLDSDPQCWDTRSSNGRTPLHTAGGERWKEREAPTFQKSPDY